MLKFTKGQIIKYRGHFYLYDKKKDLDTSWIIEVDALNIKRLVNNIEIISFKK